MAGAENHALPRELWAHRPGVQRRGWLLESGGLGSSADSAWLPWVMWGKYLLISGPPYPGGIMEG